MLDIVCEQSLKTGKYVMILDTTGNCNVYFEYKATQREFHKEMVAVHCDLKDKRTACESIRHSLVYCMRAGDRLVIFVDKLVPDFNKEFNFEPDHWPSKEIFDFEHWRDNDNYMKVVKQEENHDILLVKDKFCMHDNFQLVYLATYQDEAHVQKILENTPHSD